MNPTNIRRPRVFVFFHPGYNRLSGKNVNLRGSRILFRSTRKIARLGIRPASLQPTYPLFVGGANRTGQAVFRRKSAGNRPRPIPTSRRCPTVPVPQAVRKSRARRPGLCGCKDRPFGIRRTRTAQPCRSPSSPSAGFDRPAGNAAPRVDRPVGTDRRDRTGVHAGAAGFRSRSRTNGASDSNSAVVTTSPSNRNEPSRGFASNELRPIQPRPASTAHDFSASERYRLKNPSDAPGTSSRR